MPTAHLASGMFITSGTWRSTWEYRLMFTRPFCFFIFYFQTHQFRLSFIRLSFPVFQVSSFPIFILLSDDPPDRIYLIHLIFLT